MYAILISIYAFGWWAEGRYRKQSKYGICTHNSHVLKTVQCIEQKGEHFAPVQ